MDLNIKFYKYIVSIILILLVIFLLGQIGFVLDPLISILKIILFPFIGAGLFYYLLRPLIRYLGKKINKTVAVISVFLAIIGLVAILSIFGGEFVQREFNTFINELQAIQKSTENILSEDSWWIFQTQELESKVISILDPTIRKLGENITSWVSTVLNIGTITILIPIVTFFLLKDDTLFYNSMIKLIPKKHRNTATLLLRDIDDTLSTYITGQLIVATFLGIITYIGYLIIGLPNAMILALFLMVASIIPYLGPFIASLPAVLIGLTSDYFMAIKVVIVLTVAQQLEGNLISPNVMGNRLGIHPLTIIFIVIVGVALYGFIGAFIAIPVYSVIKVIILHFFGEQTENDQ